MPTSVATSVHLACTGDNLAWPTGRVGFVVMTKQGAPVRTKPKGGKGGYMKHATIYRYAGHARRIALAHPGKVLTAFVKNSSDLTDDDMPIGFCIVTPRGTPMPTGKEGEKSVRLYQHVGFAERGARLHGAAGVRRVYI